MGRENFEMFVDKGCGGNENVSREGELSIFFFLSNCVIKLPDSVIRKKKNLVIL